MKDLYNALGYLNLFNPYIQAIPKEKSDIDLGH